MQVLWVGGVLRSCTLRPAILALFRAYDNSLLALVEPEAVHCGTCKPRGGLVRLDGLVAWLAPEK